METQLRFAVDLFHDFEAVCQHSITRRKAGDDFLYLLKERASQEEAYAKGLERLGNNPHWSSNQGTLAQAVSAMKSDSLNKALQSRILYDNITHDLIAPFRDLLRLQTNTIKGKMNDGKALEKERLATGERLDKAKLKYWKSCTDCEQIVLLVESSDPSAERDKHIEKLKAAKTGVDRSIKDYSEALRAYNGFVNKYNADMVGILNVFQEQEEERVAHMKDTLRKLVVYETAGFRNLQYDIENTAQAMEGVNVQAEVDGFIKEHALKDPRPQIAAEDFIPYQGTHSSFKNMGNNPPMITVPLPMDEILQYISSGETKADAGELYKQQMNSIVSKAWDGEELLSNDYIQFNSMMKDPVGRKSLIWALNYRKLQGHFIISQTGFTQISELLLSVLNECDRTRDISTIKSIITLSQVFYKEKTCTTEPRELLQMVIAQHSVWNNFEIWELVIQSSVDEEVKKYQPYDTSENENPSEIISRIKNIVFVQLGSFATVMISFKSDTMYTAELVSKYACKYDLSNDDIDVLMATIDKEYQIKKKPEVITEVLRGIPEWLQELETAASAIISRRESSSWPRLTRSSEEEAKSE